MFIVCSTISIETNDSKFKVSFDLFAQFWQDFFSFLVLGHFSDVEKRRLHWDRGVDDDWSKWHHLEFARRSTHLICLAFTIFCFLSISRALSLSLHLYISLLPHSLFLSQPSPFLYFCLLSLYLFFNPFPSHFFFRTHFLGYLSLSLTLFLSLLFLRLLWPSLFFLALIRHLLSLCLSHFLLLARIISPQVKKNCKTTS